MKKNKIIYALLTLLHLVLLIITFIKKKEKKPWLLFSASVGLAYVFEYFVLNLFRSYIYYPKILKNRRMDSVLGAIVSQAFTLPATATFIAVFRLNWWWKIGFTLFYAGIERLFLYLHLFKRNWWRTSYTLIGLPFYFWLTQKWSYYLWEKPSKWIGYGTLFFTSYINYLNIHFILIAVFKKIIFRKSGNWNKYVQSFIIGPIYGAIQSVVILIVTIKERPLLGLSVLHLLDRLLYRFKWIKTKKWSINYFLPIHICLLLLGRIFKKQIVSGNDAA